MCLLQQKDADRENFLKDIPSFVCETTRLKSTDKMSWLILDKNTKSTLLTNPFCHGNEPRIFHSEHKRAARYPWSRSLCVLYYIFKFNFDMLHQSIPS